MGKLCRCGGRSAGNRGHAQSGPVDASVNITAVNITAGNDATCRDDGPRSAAGCRWRNHLVADLIALLQGGGQNTASAVVADLQALFHAAGVNNNGLATLLGDLHAASNPGAPAATNAPAGNTQSAGADAGALSGGGPADAGPHHFQADMAHHFHHMWG